MKNIPRGTPPPHFVIPDTNILWYNDKGPAVNPEFDSFWESNSSQMELHLIVPEVVIGEILFQQTTSATKLLDKTSECLKGISNITSLLHSHRLTKDKILTQVDLKIQRWLKSKSGSIAPIPVGSIDWKRVAKDAIWRQPPFLNDPKNPDLEKGFRDLLILETVVDFVSKKNGNFGFVFLSNDSMIRDASITRLQADKRFNAFESLEEFSSYIKLTKENITQKFIKAILEHARKKFLNLDDPSSLWVREHLKDKFYTEFKEKIEKLEDLTESLISFMGVKIWEPLNVGKWWIYNPEFTCLIGQKEYHWKSRVVLVKQFRRSSIISQSFKSLELTVPPEKVLFVNIAVLWTSNIKADGRFQSMSVESIEFIAKDFRVPTEADIKDFQLEKANGN